MDIFDGVASFGLGVMFTVVGWVAVDVYGTPDDGFLVAALVLMFLIFLMFLLMLSE